MERGLHASAISCSGATLPTQPIAKRLTYEQAVNRTWVVAPSKNTPRQIYSTEPLHATSFDYNDASMTHWQAMSRDALSQHRYWGASDPDEFEDHWSRLCDMEWDIVQELPQDIKRRLGNEWELDELEPVRYTILKSKHSTLIHRPDGDWRAPLHLYLSSPSFVTPSRNVPSAESGIPSTAFFINSRIDESWCFITYCFPRRSECQPRTLSDVNTKEFGLLYEFYLREHIPKCLKMGGQVILVFGDEAKEIFQQMLWDSDKPNKAAHCPHIIHGGVLLDVDIVTSSNSKLYRETRHDDIRHLIIYVPGDCPFVTNTPIQGKDNESVQDTIWAMKTGASIDYAALLIGKELPHSRSWRESAL